MKQIAELKSFGKGYFTENNHIYVASYRIIIDENNETINQVDFRTKYKNNSLCGKETQCNETCKFEKETDILNNKEICPLCIEELKKIIKF